MVFASDEAKQAWERRLREAGLTYVGTHEQGAGTYVVLRGDDPERAKAYLRAEPITREFHYVVVETPDGVWGADHLTLYLENLRPWQRDVGTATCTGRIEALINGTHNLEAAAQGIQDNFLVEVACGGCAHTWIDAVGYQQATVVRCPGCGAVNRVDSSGFTVTRH
jgi:ribosomal protein S27E